MYTHHVYTSIDAMSMLHGRESARPSGLIISEEIGRTEAVYRPGTLSLVLDSGIELPTINTTAIIAGQELQDGHRVLAPEIIDCEDLDDFIQKGVERWEKMISGLGDTVIKVRTSPSAEETVIEAQTASGILLPHEPATTEFIGYNADPDEIAALDELEKSVNMMLNRTRQAPDSPGLYI